MLNVSLVPLRYPGSMGTRKTPFGTFGSLRCTYAANATAEIWGHAVFEWRREGGGGRQQDARLVGAVPRAEYLASQSLLEDHEIRTAIRPALARISASSEGGDVLFRYGSENVQHSRAETPPRWNHATTSLRVARPECLFVPAGGDPKRIQLSSSAVSQHD